MPITLWDKVKEPWAGFSRRDLFRQGGMLAAAQALGGSVQRAVAAPLEIGREHVPLDRRPADHQRARHLHDHHRIADACRK